MGKFASVDEYAASLPEAQREITDKLLPLIEATLPGLGALWHGHPVWSRDTASGRSPICHVKAYPSYVTFGFTHGQQITDPSGRLEAGNQAGVAAVKLHTVADVDTDLFGAWLRAARGIEESAGG